MTRNSLHDQGGDSVRAGVTIVELIVAVGVAGLLMALALPAVQHARVTARRVTCQNNLRQFGVAINSHAEAHGVYPTTSAPGSAESAYWRLLPYFARSDLLDALRRSQAGGPFPDNLYIASFGCPDDPVVWLNMKVGEASYFYNAGTRFRNTRPPNGFLKATDTSPRDITDGLSQTVAMSERLVSHFPPPQDIHSLESDPRRPFWWTQVRYGNPGDEPLAIEQCRSHRTTPFPQFMGMNVHNLSSLATYDHMLPPNHPACYNGPENFGIEPSLRLIPASSNHWGGVHSLLADGSVHFVSESIDAAVWQALGTRNGQETFALPF